MSLKRRCAEAANRLESSDFLRIVSDDDADGIAAAGVITAALDRAGVPFHLTLDRLHVDQYADLSAHDAVLLLDQGAGELDELARHPGEVTVLDHHVVDGRAPHALHVNPNLEGYDGTSECCTATLALLVALEMEPTNADLAPVAMAGMIGDRQHVPQLRSVNQDAIQRALDRGTLEAMRGLPFEPNQPLGEALATSVDPFLPSIAGRASEARSFLEALDIPPSATPAELSDEATRRLTSAIVAHLISHDVESRSCEEVAGRRYTGRVADRRITASRLAAMLDASAREETPSLGIAIAHGDVDAFDQADALVEAYEEDVLKGLLKLERDPPKRLDAIQVFEAIDPDLVGAHCGLGMTYLFDKSRPAFGLKTSNGNLKVSGRATQPLVDAGLDLADALRRAADAVGGNGGGHPIAAGAMVPLTERDAFLERVDEIVEAQLHGA